ncbi:MAG: hypothetical protein V7637_6330, partial [Mycobacteriales bacterium]
MIRRAGVAPAAPAAPPRPSAEPARPAGRRRLPRLTLRLRLAVLFGGLLAVVAVTLLGTAAVVLDRTIRTIPQFPAGQTLLLRDSAGRMRTVDSADFSRLLR